MMFKEIIDIYVWNHTKTHQYTMQSSWSVKQLVHIVTTQFFKGLIQILTWVIHVLLLIKI
jgi:hypothetical protein